MSLMTSWWRHQMETFPRYWPFVRGIHRSPVNSPHKGQRRGALMFSLICARINRWTNNRKAGDLRRCRSHCDVIVMYICWRSGTIKHRSTANTISYTRSQLTISHHWHYNDLIMSATASQATGVSIVCLTVSSGARFKANIKVPRHWHFWGEFTDDRWIPRTKGQ